MLTWIWTISLHSKKLNSHHIVYLRISNTLQTGFSSHIVQQMPENHTLIHSILGMTSSSHFDQCKTSLSGSKTCWNAMFLSTFCRSIFSSTKSWESLSWSHSSDATNRVEIQMPGSPEAQKPPCGQSYNERAMVLSASDITEERSGTPCLMFFPLFRIQLYLWNSLTKSFRKRTPTKA